MERNYALAFCRDNRGAVRAARVPAGIAEPGMMVRLVGGAFLLIERVEEWVDLGGEVPVLAAAELLKPVWGRCCG